MTNEERAEIAGKLYAELGKHVKATHDAELILKTLITVFLANHALSKDDLVPATEQFCKSLMMASEVVATGGFPKETLN